MAESTLLRCRMETPDAFAVETRGGEVVLRFAVGTVDGAKACAEELNRQLYAGHLRLEVVRTLEPEVADG